MKKSKPKKSITVTYTSKFRFIYLAKAAAFVAGFIVIFLFSGKILQPKWYYDTPEGGDGRGYTDSYRAFFDADENSIDVLFLGPSTGLNSFLPIALYKETGVTSYNLCSGVQMMEVSYYLLKDAWEFQKPECVILDISALTYEEATMGYSEHTEYFPNNYKVLSQLPNRKDRYTALKKIKPSNVSVYEWMLPLVQFHDRWDRLMADDFLLNKGYSVYPSFYKGTLIATGIAEWWGLKKPQTVNISNEQSQYFQNIVSFCKKNDIILICVKGPTAVSWSKEKHDIVKKYLCDNGLSLIDYSYGDTKLNIDWAVETPDRGYHVNYYGALKATHDIGERLMALGILADHRDEDAYADWNEAVKEYDEFMWERLSTGDEKAYRFLDSLIENYQDNKNKVILISVMDDVSDGWNEKYDDYRRKLGLNANLYDNYRCSYAAVIEDGNIIYEKQGDELLLYHDAIYDNEGTPHKLELISAGMGQGNYCNIKIDDVDYAYHAKGLNIIVYDKSTNSVDTSVAIDTFGDGYFYKKNY